MCVSVLLQYLVKSPFDDHLKWPFIGEITIHI